MLKSKLFIALSLISTSAFAETVRQHDSHEHGVGKMFVSIEGANVNVEVESPSINFIGFEHKPENDEQRLILSQTTELLNEPSSVIDFNTDCSLVSQKVEAPFSEEHSEHSEHSEHDEHDEHDEHEVHTEFTMQYAFKCDDISQLTNINVKLLDSFPLTEEISVNLISENVQKSIELTKGNTNFDLQ